MTALGPAADNRLESLRRAFPRADTASIDALAIACSVLCVPGGVAIIHQGEPSDAVYVVVSGLFAAYRQDDLLSRLVAGEIIGEIGFITGEARTATVRALRNSVVLRMSRDDLEAAATRCPGVLLAISSTVVQRLRRAESGAAEPFHPRTFCLIAGDADIDCQGLLETIAATLSTHGSVTIVSPEQAAGREAFWFSDRESSFDYVLYKCDHESTRWTRFCLRQCDRVLLAVHGEGNPAGLGPLLAGMPKSIPLSLMLLWRSEIVPGRSVGWLNHLTPADHHHIRFPGDLARAARLVAGRGRGLVLSGGGAKGLAHVGVLDALIGHGVCIDAIGGTSIGGIVAAAFALEWDLARTARTLVADFTSRRLSDFALPRTAVFSKRAFQRTLSRWFGGIAIEETPVPLFCVSTNLTEGRAVIHKSGPLETWLRASCAIPGLFPPVARDDAVYVDGGVLNNLPTDAVRTFGVTSVISVDVATTRATPAGGPSETPHILDLLWRVGTIGSGTTADRAVRDGDIVLQPEVAHIRLLGWNARDEAIRAGQRAVLDHIDQIRASNGDHFWQEPSP